MKTAEEFLKENDFIPNDHGHYVYGCGYHNVSLVHILEEYASIHANQKLDEAAEKANIVNTYTFFNGTTEETFSDRVEHEAYTHSVNKQSILTLKDKI